MRKSKVVSLHGEPIPLAQINDEIVQQLENMLQLARDGQIWGLIWSWIEPSRAIGRGWAGADNHSLTAAAALLAHELTTQALVTATTEQRR